MENLTIEVLDRQEAKVIYTKDMMDYEINVYGTEDEPLFYMVDIANWLESKGNPRDLGRMIDDCEKIMLKVRGLDNKVRQSIFVTEDGLYEICMRSNLPKAKRVRKFIKSILKELRTKGYVVNNNSEIANAMTMIAQSLQPMQQALIGMQKENEQFKSVILEEQFNLKAKTQAIENTLSYFKIDFYDLNNLKLTIEKQRNKHKEYFESLSMIYKAKSTQISMVWDSVIYAEMYKCIGREKITLFDDKRLHVNQSIRDITKQELPKCLDFAESFTLDRDEFEEKIKNKYGYRNNQ